MEETYNTRVIILRRDDFREADSRIVCFSEDFGKLELVARGAKKTNSKAAGHLEPLTLSRLMVVRGRDFNYVGTARGEEFYHNIKGALDKISIAGQAAALIDKMTREGEADGQQEIFLSLKNFLDSLEKAPSSEAKKGGGYNFKDFIEKLHILLGFSREDFEELRLK